eukprot:1159213-Pelagomonas_calceolata.AAC.9
MTGCHDKASLPKYTRNSCSTLLLLTINMPYLDHVPPIHFALRRQHVNRMHQPNLQHMNGEHQPHLLTSHGAIGA